MEKTVIVCDSCGSQTFDQYKETNWITVQGTGSTGGALNIIQHKGRENGGQAKSKSGCFVRQRATHYCCRSCLENKFGEILDTISK